MRQQPLDIVAGSYSDETRPFSSQDTVNYLPVFAEQGGTRTPTMLKTPPGLRPFVQVLDTSEDIARPIGPVRRTHNCEGKLFAVMGQTLYQVTPSGVAIPQGTIPGVGRCSMAHNQLATGNQLVTVNGTSGYCFNTQTQVFERITDEGFPGAIKVIFMDGYIIGIEPRRRFAFNSEVADALAYNTLDRFTSEYLPDLLVSLESVQNQLVLFSEGSMEFFENTGATEQPFRSKRISQKRGCAGTFTTAVIDQTVYWLGDDGIFYRLEGYAPKRISTRPIEQAIRGLDWKNAFAETWTDAGHLVVYWTFPDGLTWGYDISSGQWHRRQSYGFNRWRPSTLTYINSEWVAGDFQNGRLWKLDWDYVLEGDDEIISERVTQTLADNQNRMLVSRLELIVDTGQPLTEPAQFPDQPEPPTISGIPPESIIGEAITPFQFTLGDGTPPYRVTLRAGTIPPGLSISQQGLLTGTPTRAGTFTYTLRNTDSTGLYADHEVSQQVTVPVFVVGRTGASTYRVMRLAGTTNWNVAPAFPPFSPVFYALGLEGGRILAWSQGTSAYSDDHGATWSTPAVQLGGHAGPRSGCERDGVVLITGGSTTSIYRSVDGGATFSEVTGYPDSMYYAVTAETGILMASQAAGKFVFSEDGGLTHEERANTNVSLSGGGAVAYLRHAGAAVLGGYNTSNNAASVAVTDDEGATSTRHDLPEISIVTAVGAATIDDEDVWVCGLANGKVYRTKDFSTWTAWSDVLPGAARFVVWDGVRFSVGGDDSSYVLTSEDGVTATRRTCSMTAGVSAAVPTHV